MFCLFFYAPADFTDGCVVLVIGLKDFFCWYLENTKGIYNCIKDKILASLRWPIDIDNTYLVS
ncbi:hypothetical protein EG346_13655 [Chryseobacterium carnipullorum]|uniref:Uncharacterized protein n=1 Tax=Chryseobacterium carnipullorum TaxID=1124835 RepID=A0A3G6NGM0_CHRCU|nr:hypothetical protein EG346_13655 [Chryseobacterium carnipullorum]AZA64049.1 hypothetical protein EG345_04585 [Chryseobacterium carnipullorum]